MRSPFSFQGELGRTAYGLAVVAAFLVQHLFALVAFSFAEPPSQLDWRWFWLMPLGAMAHAKGVPPMLLPLGMAVTLIVDWMLLAFSIRRARRVGFEGFAAGVAVPLVQFLAFGLLLLAPDMKTEDREAQRAGPAIERNIAVFQSVLVGMALCVAALVFQALVLGLYGYGMFVFSPMLIGAICGYLCNRKGELGSGLTFWIAIGALTLGGALVMSIALEGLICVVFAAPLIYGAGAIGALVGRELALGRRTNRSRLMSAAIAPVAIAPVLMAAELLAPPHVSFESIESVEVNASPDAVWDAIVHMGPIPDAPAAPFRWGLAYPMRGEIEGAGVGAIRRGVFSTGVAYERVTEWEPGRKLSFVVLSDPPSMRELSVHDEVNAPHTVGYFKTLDARFTISSIEDGKTRLELATKHELDLEPALYWLPFAQWAIRANKDRVLAHFKRQAEGGAPAAY